MIGAAIACPGCGTANPPGARFCSHCGRSLPAPDVSCPSCGTHLPAASRFCFNCGHELTAGAAAGQVGLPAQAVTATIADQLRAGGPGERRTITLLFCDVQDSTATAERLDPEDWSQIMREALTRFITPVERYGGTVARILGDAILAYFGAPLAHEDDPQRAVLAGLAIAESCREFGEEVQRRHGVPFGVRVGINTGLVVVGDVGSTLYGEYAALGDAANVAARMEQTAEAGTVRIADPTARLVSAFFDLHPIGPIAVKGRAEPVTAYRVVQAKVTPGTGRGIAGLTSPVVGRDAELATLHRTLSDLRAGRGQIVSLIGEAGLGKSRLAAEMAAAADGVTWIEGGCYSYENTTPYAPISRALRDFLDVTGDDHAPVAQRLTELIGPDGRPRAAHLAGVVGTRLPIEDEEFLRFLEPPVLRQRAFEAVMGLIEALTRQGCVVLTIEDLHWADPTSVDLVESLLPLTERAPLLILLRFRPNRGEPSWRVHETASRDFRHRYTAIELRPLSDDAAQELVANLLHVDGLSLAMRQTILGKSEGNPFFVEEVIRSLLDAGIVVRENDRFVVAGDIAGLKVPDTLTGVLTARLDTLEPTAKHVAQTAAVLGREFSHEMLRELVDPTHPLEGSLVELERRELVVLTALQPDRTYTFKHALTRDAAYNSLLLSVRRDLHRLVGKLIEERHPDRVHDLAHHFLEADEPFRALPYLVAAGERAFQAFALGDASRLFEQALGIWSDGQDPALARRAYEGLGGARMFGGDMAGALEIFKQLESFADTQQDPQARISALNKQGMVHLMGTGDVAEAERVLLAARSEAEATDDLAGLAEFHVGFCVLNVTTGRLAEATEHLGEAAEVCFVLDPFHRNFGLTHYATTLLYQVRLEEAGAAFDRAWAQASADNDRLHMGHLRDLQAQLELFAGEAERALGHALEASAVAAELGVPMDEAQARWTVGVIASHLGRYELAAAGYERAAELGRASGFFGMVAAGMSGLAVIHQALHGTGSARVRELLTEAQSALTKPMGAFSTGAVAADMAAILVREGDMTAAATAVQRAADTRSATMLLAKPEALLCTGFLELSRGNVAAGLAALGEAASYVEESGLRHYQPRTLLGEAIIASYDGDVPRMVDKLDAAARTASDMHLRPAAVLIYTKGAELLDAAGLTDRAAELRARAAETTSEIAGMIHDDELRAAYLRSRAVKVG